MWSRAGSCPSLEARIVSKQVMQRRSFVTLVASGALLLEAPALLAGGMRSVVVQPLGPGSTTPAGLVGSSLAALRASAQSPWA